MAGDMTARLRNCHRPLLAAAMLLAGAAHGAGGLRAAGSGAGVAETGSAGTGSAGTGSAGTGNGDHYRGGAVVTRLAVRRDAPRGAALLRQALLDGHNRARGAVGVSPLRWDDGLEAAAQAHADALARRDRMEHASQPGGTAQQGENLWMGTGRAFRYEDMNEGWVAERRDFIDAATPAFSRTGRWQDVGHYSQIVWRGTAAVGCAAASNGANDYLVCRYWPAGNVIGQRVF